MEVSAQKLLNTLPLKIDLKKSSPPKRTINAKNTTICMKSFFLFLINARFGPLPRPHELNDFGRSQNAVKRMEKQQQPSNMTLQNDEIINIQLVL